jgi:hypothetical protein
MNSGVLTLRMPAPPYHVRTVISHGVRMPARLGDGSYIVEGPHVGKLALGEMLAIVPPTAMKRLKRHELNSIDTPALALSLAIAVLPELIEAARAMLPWVDEIWAAHVVEDGSKCENEPVQKLREVLAKIDKVEIG